MILLLTFFFFVPPFFRYSGATGKDRFDDDGIEECVIDDRKAACAQERLLLPTQNNNITDEAKATTANDLNIVIFITQVGGFYLFLTLHYPRAIVIVGSRAWKWREPTHQFSFAHYSPVASWPVASSMPIDVPMLLAYYFYRST
eukprot:scaffold3999_cov80-Skeletonema_menzelii.AAC.1